MLYPRRRRVRTTPRTPAQLLHAALTAYGLNRRTLRQLASQDAADLHAMLHDPHPPPELLALLDLQTALLTPLPCESVHNAADVAALLMLRLGLLDQEQLITICLDGHNHVQTIALIYQGSVNKVLVRAAEIFKPAIRHNSYALIVAHNHPGGTLAPSIEDLALTERCIELGKQLDIVLVDHLIIGGGRWVSVRAWLRE